MDYNTYMERYSNNSSKIEFISDEEAREYYNNDNNDSVRLSYNEHGWYATDNNRKSNYGYTSDRNNNYSKNDKPTHILRAWSNCGSYIYLYGKKDKSGRIYGYDYRQARKFDRETANKSAMYMSKKGSLKWEAVRI